jgi:hypothetical protein
VPRIKENPEMSIPSQKRVDKMSAVSQPIIFNMAISLFSSGDKPDALSQARIIKAASVVSKSIEAKPPLQPKIT